jgi:hybrid cluster-associated redox disulfide protein
MKKSKQIITKLRESKLSAHQKSQKISADMTISETIARYPDTIPILMKYGMHCIGCPMAMQETLEQGLSGHGIPVEKIIDELNKKAKKK